MLKTVVVVVTDDIFGLFDTEEGFLEINIG